MKSIDDHLDVLTDIDGKLKLVVYQDFDGLGSILYNFEGDFMVNEEICTFKSSSKQEALDFIHKIMVAQDIKLEDILDETQN